MEPLSLSLYQPPIDGWCLRQAPKLMQNDFLVVGDTPDSSWNICVNEALETLGSIDVLPEGDAIERTAQKSYRMIIIDAGAVADLATLIIALRRTSPSVPIVVATASPTWQTAKEALMTGANDCIRKSVNPEKLKSTLQEILFRPR